MEPHRNNLREARKTYSACANKIEQHITTQGLTPVLSTQVIGIGIACEWLSRASGMEEIKYIGEVKQKSKTNDLFLELLRFNFSWFAVNAIYGREELLPLLGTPPTDNGEYLKFKFLYDTASLTTAPTRLIRLHELLNKEVTTRLPNLLTPRAQLLKKKNEKEAPPIITLKAISLKYLPRINSAIDTAIRQAVQQNDARSLDMPTLLYSFRNWSVHGSTLHGCFGSRPGFYEYVCLLQETLAEVHKETATKLEKKLEEQFK